MSIKAHLKESKIGVFWLKYEDKLVIGVGMALIAAICFEAGLLYGKKQDCNSVAISNYTASPDTSFEEGKANLPGSTSSNESSKSNTALTAASEINEPDESQNQKCSLIASKNSDKYHLPNCRWAQNIKPENKICFSSEDEAKSNGYQPAKCCIK